MATLVAVSVSYTHLDVYKRQKQGYAGVAKNLDAVMHQRMGFFVSKKNRLLTLAYYGIALDAKDDPNDGKGIGRVVREIYPDGRFGEIYFCLLYTSSCV